jgi:hypothetical protein
VVHFLADIPVEVDLSRSLLGLVVGLSLSAITCGQSVVPDAPEKGSVEEILTCRRRRVCLRHGRISGGLWVRRGSWSILRGLMPTAVRWQRLHRE